MAFQDFDQISERRKQERQRKIRQRIIIGSLSGILLVGLIGAVVGTVVRTDKHSDASGAPKSPQKQVLRMQQAIQEVCNTTMYKDTCQNHLEKAVSKNSDGIEKKDLLKLAVQEISNEVDVVSQKIAAFNFNSPQEKVAFSNCQKLMRDAVNELNQTVSQSSGDITTLALNSKDMNNWLSAVMSYQETCIDGFPNGTLKDHMGKAFATSKQLTSISLAMVHEITSFLSLFQVAGSRRLLEDKTPYWVDRRMLRGAETDKPTPNVTVAKDGSGQFTTITAALAAMPASYTGRYVIYVKAGIYNEYPNVTANMVNITMYGDGSQKTIITGNKSFSNGDAVLQSATFSIEGDGFMGKALGFRNTAGPEGHRAIAVRVQGDRAIFLNCRFEGYQGTVYAQAHRQFYRSCVITGTLEFIFGDASAVFQNCLITVRKPMEDQRNAVTSHTRADPKEMTGFVLQNCKIQADADLAAVKDTVDSFLGRPGNVYSRTVVMETQIDDFINKLGYSPLMGTYGTKTGYFAEYNNTGAGASTAGRVKWDGFRVIAKEEAQTFTVKPFINGDWIVAAGAPVHFDL